MKTKLTFLALTIVLSNTPSFAGDISSGGPQLAPYTQSVMNLRALLDSEQLRNSIGINNHILATVEQASSEPGITDYLVRSEAGCSVIVKTRFVQVPNTPAARTEIISVGFCQ